MKVSTHLMFQGDAAAALALYAAVFPAFRVLDGGGAEAPGVTRIDFAGHPLIVFDSPTPHDFGFTPAMSLYVDLDTAEALDQAAAALSEGGAVLMPPGDYGFSARFAWVTDRFGVSWQVNLPHSS